MSIEEFWYEDSDLLTCYVQAYYKRLHNQCWTNGLYTLRAMESTFAELMPISIQIGLGLIKKKKTIKEVQNIRYFDKPIPEIVKSEKAKLIVRNLNEKGLMELDRMITNKFK